MLSLSLSVSLSLSLSLSSSSPLLPLIPPNQQMVNDSWPGCRRAIVSVALLYGHAENRVTLCVLFRARAIRVCERLTTFYLC